MPRTKLDEKFNKPRHESDRVKALILEAVRTQRVSGKELAKMAGCGETSYYAMMNKHSDTWPLSRIKGLYKGLNIPIEELRAVIRL